MSDAVEQLKQVKVPLWAHWLGYWRARRRRKEAAKEVRYIATVFAWTKWREGGYARQWWICKTKGNKRYYEYSSNSVLLRNDDKGKNHPEYARIIAPWIGGHWTNKQLADYGRNTEKQYYE